MNMDYINFNKEKCKGCGACVKACPIPEANIVSKTIDDDIFVDIKADKCIGCGKCLEICKSGAREAVDDIEEFMADLKKGTKCALLVSPEFKFSFNGNWKSILDWFKRKGVTQIYDGAYGAEIHAWASATAIKQNKTITGISSTCPAMTNYIMSQKGTLVDKIIPVYCADACMLIYIKKYLYNLPNIAVLSPCLAEKAEVREAGAKYFITCKSLKKYFDANNIVIRVESTQTASYDFSEKQGWFGGLMGMSQGFASNLWYMQPEDFSLVVTDTGDEVFSTVDNYTKMPDFKKLGILNLSPCNGCNNSACSAKTISDFEAAKFYRGLSLESADMREISGGRFSKGKHKDELYYDFENRLRFVDYKREFKAIQSDWQTPNKFDLERIYADMGLKEGEYELDCGLCGYATCELMATAIHNKQNICENCVMFARRKGSVEDRPINVDLDVLTNSTFKLYADIEEIKSSVAEIKAKSKISREMSVAIDKLLTNMVNTCKTTTFDESTLEGICEVLDKLKVVVAALTTAMTTTNNNAAIVDEAVSNINVETQHLSQMIADLAGISVEEMGRRVESVKVKKNSTEV